MINSKQKEYIYYRCNYHIQDKLCDNSAHVSEQAIEQWLLDNVENEIHKSLAEYQSAVMKRRKPEIDTEAIKRRLTRLKTLFINGMIEWEEYLQEHTACTEQLAAAQASEELPELNVKGLTDFLNSDFKAVYHGLDKEERRTLWRGIVREIHIDAQKRITISFV